MTVAAIASPAPAPDDPLHVRFLAILPRIERHGRIYFRQVKCPHKKEDCIADMVGLCWHWFQGLAERGRDGTRFPMALAAFAARHVHSGRKLCGQEKSKDVLSPVAQQKHNFTVQSLPTSTRAPYDHLCSSPLGQERQDVFEERLRDNTITPVPDQVIFRIDFPAWRRTHSQRNRRVIDQLMRGERTKDVAKKFGTTPGRISQLRREFHGDWERFCAPPPEAEE
jgi:hypothetical protein